VLRKAWIWFLGTVAVVFGGITIYGAYCVARGTHQWWELFGPGAVAFISFIAMQRRIGYHDAE
jgi:hypothetical protein